ncbi:hypothetical protein GCM10010149_02590 [Nonomuraea roseoviolacea subsp. roseoviolacea]|uniref:hypothetical protein n=1 Tax=Nonomuraea roseoviolacea TaxID=103837 RepID=UPI0031DED948
MTPLLDHEALERSAVVADNRMNRELGLDIVAPPFAFLGADDRAGPDYTGQPAVDSHDEG